MTTRAGARAWGETGRSQIVRGEIGHGVADGANGVGGAIGAAASRGAGGAPGIATVTGTGVLARLTRVLR